jgi:hypothetical protein
VLRAVGPWYTFLRDIFNDWDASAAQAATQGTEVTLVFVNVHSGQGYITVDGNEATGRTSLA